MMYFSKIRTLFLLLGVLGFVSDSLQKKVVNCIKYPLAPVCRGVAAKRALSKLPTSGGDPRETTVLDFDTYDQWKDEDKGLNEKELVRIILKKLEPETADYDSQNLENY